MSTPALPKLPFRWLRWAGYVLPPGVRIFRSPEGGRTRTQLVLELFAVLGFSACYYFLVRNFAQGVGNDHTNYWVFAACGKSGFNLDVLYDVWKGRLPGLLLSGLMFDWVFDGESYSVDQYAMVFGLYQSLWLLMLLLTMVVAVRHSLLVNLGIFAGLLYNFTPAAGFYFYPWDLPATMFLTLAVLLHARGHRLLMLAALGVGCLFKETVLVGAILCLFCREWKGRWRILSFVGLAVFYMLSKRYLMSTLHLRSAVLAMGDATNLRQLLRPEILLTNLKLLYSAKAPLVLLANAGTLVAVLVLGWERRFRPYMWLIAVFVAGHLVYAAYAEVRIFMQVLPLSCLILSEYAYGRVRRSADAAGDPQLVSSPDECGGAAGSGAQAPDWTARTDGVWATWKSGWGLKVITVMLLVGTSALAAWDYTALLQSLQPEHQARQSSELRTRAERGDAAQQYALGNRYYGGVGVAANPQEALYWYREAAAKGHIGAQLRLGLCYLGGEGTAQSYEESIRRFRTVAAQGNRGGRCYGGLLYYGGLGINRERVEHFFYLAWLGPLALAVAGLSTITGFVRKRKSMLDPALIFAVVLAAGTLSWQWRYGGIEPLWQSMIARDPNSCLAWQNLGYALSKTGQLDEAIACLQKSVELEPDNADVSSNLGNLLLQKSRPDEAITHLRKAVELRPQDPDAHYNLGNVLSQEGRLDEAIAHYQKAVELSPQDPDAHNNLGVDLSNLGRLDKAIREYQEALRLRPDFADASNNLASALRLKEALATQPAPATKR